jgi:hypothetical protein
MGVRIQMEVRSKVVRRNGERDLSKNHKVMNGLHLKDLEIFLSDYVRRGIPKLFPMFMVYFGLNGRAAP